MDLKEHCCTRSDGYLGSGATYHDGKRCSDLGFHKNKGTQRLGGDTYATIMCDGNVSGFGPDCGGAEIFASCKQQLTMWAKLGKGYAVWRPRGEDAEEAVASGSASSDGFGSSEGAAGLFFSASESLDMADVVVWFFALVGLAAIGSGLFNLFKTQTLYTAVQGDTVDVEI